MTFIHPRILICGVLIHLLTLSAYSQYTGGDGSGATLYSQLPTSCNPITYPAIFTGGVEDGYTLSGITQSACSAVVMPAIFAGGQEDGYTLAAVTQSMCAPIVLPGIFAGGQEDGYTSVAVTQSNCAPIVLPNIFAGGIGSTSEDVQLLTACAPLADFVSDATTICVGDTVHFTDLSLGSPTLWAWSFPGGTPASASIQNPTVIYNSPGIYDVSLSITAPDGSSSITETNYINVIVPPVVSISSISPFCADDGVHTLTEGSPAGGVYSGSGVLAGVFNPVTAGPGTHILTYTYTTGGCINSATINITVNPVYSVTLNHAICAGETYNWQGSNYNTAGTYTANYVSSMGCDSTYTLNLSVNPDFAFTDNHTICNGDSYLWHGTSYNIAGTYTASYTSIHGCDSIYTLNLSVDPIYAFTDNQSICSGDSYTWHGTSYNTAGTYIASYTSIHGCDSIYTLHLYVDPVYAFNDNHTICNGDSYLWHGTSYTAGGTYTANYTSIHGCDSIYTLLLIVAPNYAFTNNHTMCNGDTYVWQGNNYNLGGTYTAPYTSVAGCDSIYTLHLSVYPSYSFTENHSICSGEVFNWHGNGYSSTGTYVLGLNTVQGCDSSYTLNLTVYPTYTFNQTHTMCNGEIFTWHGNNYTTTGNYVASYTTIHGCDSIYHLDLTVNTVDVNTNLSGITITANALADAYQWLDCDNGYAPISGETGQSYIASLNGNYAVLVTQGSCFDTSDCVQITTVGIETGNFVGMALYPNPTDGRFTLVLDQDADVEVYSAQGSIVYKSTYTKGTYNLSLALADGVYVLKANNDKGSKIVRIVVRK